MSPTMKELLRTTLMDEQPGVAAGFAVDQAIAVARRRRRRRLTVASGAVTAVAASAVVAVTLWPSGVPVEEGPAAPAEVRLTLPPTVDLTAATPVAPDADLTVIFQTADPADGALSSYGLTEAGAVVRLPDLPALPTTTGDWGVTFDHPVQLSADGHRALVQKTGDAQIEDPAPLLVDTRTGERIPIPWQPHYRAAGLSPDGASLAVVTFAGEVTDGIFERPWGLVIIDVATGAERAGLMPEVVGRTDLAFALPPIWSPSGLLRLGVSEPGGMVEVLVSPDASPGSTVRYIESAIGTAPWSPDGSLLVTAGTSPTAYRIVHANPASAEFGARVASGAMQGRSLLGWSGSEHLLWFDPTSQALVETDLSGAVEGGPTPISASSTVIAVALAP